LWSCDDGGSVCYPPLTARAMEGESAPRVAARLVTPLVCAAAGRLRDCPSPAIATVPAAMAAHSS